MSSFKLDSIQLGSLNKSLKVHKLTNGINKELGEISQGTDCFVINDTNSGSPKSVILTKGSNFDKTSINKSNLELLKLLKQNGTILASTLSQMGYLPILVAENWEEGDLQDSQAPHGVQLPKDKQNLISWTDTAANNDSHNSITTIKDLSFSDGKFIASCETMTPPAEKDDAENNFNSTLPKLDPSPKTDVAPSKNAEEKELKNIPTLTKYARDLTSLAKDGKLDPVIGRDQETEKTIEILCCRIKNNPALIGDPGVGKTAIVEGLASRIATGSVPSFLKGKRVFSLDLSRLIAGASARGEFEDRLQKIIDEVKSSNGNIILFLDEMHTLVGSGSGSMDASNILKPSLARGELNCIGATTLDEYRKYIEKDQGLERRFMPVIVKEPSLQDTVNILKGLKGKYESFHNVTLTDKAIEAAVKLTHRYIPDRFLPDKAIDAMDLASAIVKIKQSATSSPDVVPDKAPTLKNKVSRLFTKEEPAIANSKTQAVMQVTEEDVAKVVSEWTGIPVTKLNEEESKKLINLETELHKRVIGQDEPIGIIAQAVRRNRAGLKDPKRPAGVFIFAGPTGVGKTELAKALAESIFGDENHIVRVDMSEYMEGHNVARLIGAPPGYVGHDDGGQLTEAVRKQPYSVLLFDEIEKAHPQIFNVLLQVFDDGRLTDGKGRTVDFKNTIIIMSSNLGTQLEEADQKTPEAGYKKMKDNVLGTFKRAFRPEFLNRIDEILVFKHLSKDDINKVFDIMINSINKTLKEKGYKLEVTPEAKQKLVDLGFNSEMGARPLRRVIQKHIEDPLSNEVINGKLKEGETVLVGLDEKGEIVFKNLTTSKL